jgi:hypothetical protein
MRGALGGRKGDAEWVREPVLREGEDRPKGEIVREAEVPVMTPFNKRPLSLLRLATEALCCIMLAIEGSCNASVGVTAVFESISSWMGIEERLDRGSELVIRTIPALLTELPGRVVFRKLRKRRMGVNPDR